MTEDELETAIRENLTLRMDLEYGKLKISLVWGGNTSQPVAVDYVYLPDNTGDYQS